ncbi:hypothetical protein QFZ62_001044 [Clavibacter sp. B3I6]|jgi:hypothetical protein|uniref:hypothetical protein n=1 Tax=Clavibacter sp. B3I6 TaxID=3042268 RepID=UPI0027820D98|nr:hypothetical protein [Clavibacter sp. B3I6]MDQ0743736.1 hypothetical protein [Clavibacter sp. B3I6]
MTHHDGTTDAHGDDDAKIGGEGTIPAGATGVAAGHDGGSDHFEPEEDTPHRTDEDGDGASA